MLSPEDFRPKQPAGIDFVYQGDQSLLLADVGTGKSVMLLTALQMWAQEGILDRALITAPKRVCLDTWMPEMDEWTHLDPKVLRLACLAGASAKKRMQIISDPRYNVVLINYELLPWLMEQYPDGLPGFNVLGCDEIDKLKDHTTKRFKGTPARRNKREGIDIKAVPGMKDYRRHFEIHIGATGTPTPKHMLDLWAQVFIIDGGKRLGDNYYKFRDAHFYQSDWGGYKYDILPGRDAWIHEQIADITYRIASVPGEDTPIVVELPVRWVELPAKVKKQYKYFERNYILELRRTLETGPGRGQEVDIIEAEHAATAYGKLKQFAQGFAYVGDPEARVRDAEWLTKGKYAELDSLVSELQGQQLMIVYHYKEQLAELQRRYPGLAYLGGGMSDADARWTINEWNAGNLTLMALHPMSAGHGLNLQKAGAHHIAVLTMPESAGAYTQIIGRLARMGNESEFVYVHRILMRDTIDEERDAVVHGEIQDQRDLLAAMELRNA